MPGQGTHDDATQLGRLDPSKPQGFRRRATTTQQGKEQVQRGRLRRSETHGNLVTGVGHGDRVEAMVRPCP